MNWADEPYVRVYNRDVPAFVRRVSWQARCLFWELLRHADRSGVIELGEDDPGIVASIIAGAAQDGEQIKRLVEELIADRCVVLQDGHLIIRNYIEAQRTQQSDRLRQATSREQRRTAKLNAAVTDGHAVSPAVTPCHLPSPAVTDGHAVSPAVTTCHLPSPAVTDGHLLSPMVTDCHSSTALHCTALHCKAELSVALQGTALPSTAEPSTAEPSTAEPSTAPRGAAPQKPPPLKGLHAEEQEILRTYRECWNSPTAAIRPEIRLRIGEGLRQHGLARVLAGLAALAGDAHYGRKLGLYDALHPRNLDQGVTMSQAHVPKAPARTPTVDEIVKLPPPRSAAEVASGQATLDAVRPRWDGPAPAAPRSLL
jgi:hypothetical protein